MHVANCVAGEKEGRRERFTLFSNHRWSLPRRQSGAIAFLKKMTFGVCRAAMAIMRQQANFVEQLYSSGMVDEQEQEQLLEPIEAQERKLERKGAVWRAPKIVEVGYMASSVM